MSQVRRAFVVLVSVIAAALGFMPVASARASAAPRASDTTSTRTQAAASGGGYWLVGNDGGVFAAGDAHSHGSMSGTHLNLPIVGIAPTPDGKGYWLVATDGGIFSFGDAGFHGSTGAIPLNKPIVGMTSTPSGHGYWMVASDGGIFSFGDAAFHGSTGAITLNQPIVGMASTPSGNGYWLVASDGGIFSFGDAAFHGSTGAMTLNRPIVGMASTPSGNGYWMIASDGGIFSFGDAAFHGSTGAITLNRPIVGMAATHTGNGYWFAAADGGVFSFGDAKFLGAPTTLGGPIVGMAALHLNAPATKLAFTRQPSAGAAASSDFARQPMVTVQNTLGGTVTNDSSLVQLSITPPAGGATISCTANAMHAAHGVATFAGCDIDQTGTYTLTATDGSLAPAVSTHVTITPAPAALVVATDAGGATGGVPFATQPVVHIVDAFGHVVTTDTSLVLLSIDTAPGVSAVGDPGPTLTCDQNPVHAVAGIATFSGCSIDRSGSYTLIATDGTLAPDTTDTTVTVGPPAQVGFTTEPSGGTSLVAFGTQPSVAVQDAGGNTVAGDTSGVSLSLTTANGATLACTPNNGPLSAGAGVATFVGCKIDKAGSYTLTAADGALDTATSEALTIVAAAPSKLAFTRQPSAVAAGGTNFAVQPIVSVQDASGNTVATDTTGVSLTLTTANGAVLGCTPDNGPLAAVAGVATFAGCDIDLANVTPYTLHATDGSLTFATSTGITVSAGGAARLAFTTQPSATATGGTDFAQQPVVTVQDAGGNTIAGDASSITLTITTPAGAALGCTANSVNAIGGVATFAGCDINLAGITPYTLHADDGTLVATTSTGVTVSVGTASRLGFVAQPSATATGGTDFAAQPHVAIQDAGGNTVTGNTSDVTLSITTPAGAVLGCTNNGPVSAVAGVATFAGCDINLSSATPYTLQADDGLFPPATSTGITVATGAPAGIAFITQPSTTAFGGTDFGAQPRVAIRDAGGNTVITSVVPVTLSLTTPAGAALGCTDNGPVAAVAGVVTFAGCDINLSSVTPYTLHAVSGLLTATSTGVTVSTGGAARLVFSTQPSTTATGGVDFATQPAVSVRDLGGNLIAGDVSGVTLSITTPAGAVLGCTNNGPVTAVAGVATFAGCDIDLASTTAYTLHAVDGVLAPATSGPVTITVGTPTHVSITTQPSATATGGTDFGTQPVVTVRDAGGNTVTGNTSAVTLALTTPAGAALGCTNNTVSAIAGVATFAGCDINLASLTPYTLDASDAGLAGATSIGIAVSVGGAARMAFTTQPSATATGGTNFVAQPVVTVQDAGGNTVTGDTSSVTLSLSTPAGAVLGCTSNGPIATVLGVATFAGCDINLARATPYTLRAVNGAQTALTSTPITVSVGSATQIAFVTQPSSTAVGGVSFATQPAVAVQDAGGNTVTADASGVTLTITTPAGAILACDDNGPIEASAGVATFAGCDIDLASATPYTLHAAATGLGTATSTGITITVGAPAHLAFSTQPSLTATGGIDFAQQPVVTIQDAANNTVTTDTSGVTLTITTPAGAALGCTNNGPVAAIAGVATFAGCDINLSSGTPYTLHAADGSLTVATSTGVTVSTGVPARVAFTTQPSTPETGGVDFATQPVVSVQDAGGNIVAGDTSGVTLTITTPAGAALGCTNNGPVAAIAGVATFAGCDINLAAGTPYTLHAADGSLVAATSSAINIGVGPASQLAFTSQPSTIATGGTDFAAQPVVTIRDAGGNTVTGNTTGVTLTITTPAGAALGCTPDNGPLAAVAGVATFAGCDINLSSVTPYTLHAADGALTVATSTGITVSTGSATRLGFTTQPSATATGGTDFAQQPSVSIQDAGGNTVTGNTTGVTLTITTPAGASLGCTPNNGPLAAVAGIATFAGCDINLANVTPYTLHAVDGALAAADSAGITVSVGAGAQLAFATQPSTTATGGVDFAQQPRVAVRDAGGNTVTTDVRGVTLAISTPAGAALGCTNNGPVAAVAGVATFAGCDINLAGATPYTLHATASGGLGVTSTTITVSVGVASRLGFVTQPSTIATGGVDFAQQPSVAIQDAGGNTITGNISGITLTITTPAGASLGCTPNNGPKAATAGVVTFAGCDINLASVTPYTLHAADGAFTPANSTGITVSVGPATDLAFTTQPSATATGGVDFVRQPVVSVKDAGGNTVNDTSEVTLSITAPAGGAILGCTPNNGPRAAVAGVATFAGCKIDLARGTPYTLRASDGALATASSNEIAVSVGPATQLGFTSGPNGSTAADTEFTDQPVVAVQDAGGNTVTSTITGAVTLTVADHVPASNLTCADSTETVNVEAGVATFAGCSMDIAGDGFTLTATDAGLTGTTGPFDIVPGAAVTAEFTSKPESVAFTGTDFTDQPVVTLRDAAGNIATNDSLTVVTLDLTRPSDPAEALLSCDSLSLTVVEGVASFTGCSVDSPSGSVYTLSASFAGASDTVSDPFTVFSV